MANCRYILGNKVFASEIELDDYLSAIKDIHKKYGDEVFSQRWKPIQLGYRDKLYHQKDILEEEVKAGRIVIETSNLEDNDLDGIVGKLDRRGVSQLMKELVSTSNAQLFPEFRADEYWSRVKRKMAAGDFSDFKNDQKDDLWVIFDEKDAEGNYITHPITSEEEFEHIREKFTKMWEQQSMIGTIVHDIFSIYYTEFSSGVQNKSLTKSQKLEKIKEIITKSNNYKDLVSKYNNNILLNDAFLENVLKNCDRFNEHLRTSKDFGPNIMCIPEATIKGIAVTDNDTKTVVGRIDLLVIGEKGQIDIIDFKCSPRDYSKYDSAKTLTFEYQLAIYRRILQQLGINSGEGIRLWVSPIKFSGFTLDDQDRVQVNAIELSSPILRELPNSRSTIDDARYQTVENNLDKAFKSNYVEDVSADDVLSKVQTWIKKVFPQYGEFKEITDEGVQKYAKGKVKQDKTTGKWSFYRYKNHSPEFVSDTEEQVIAQIKQEWVSNRARNIEKTKEIKRELKRATEQNLGKSAEFNIIYKQKNQKTAKIPDWAQKQLQKYATNVYSVVNTPEAFDALGIILVRNTLTDQIDVIKLSPTHDLDAKFNFGNGKNTLLGNWLSDQAVKSRPNNRIMDATRGNIELMETMYALNCIPSLFTNNNAHLGEIQVLSPYNEGGGAYNGILVNNFKELIKFSNSEESPEVDHFSDDTIKTANFLQLATDNLRNIINGVSLEGKWDFAQESYDNIIKAAGNKTETMAELMKLKDKLEGFAGNILSTNVQTTLYDEYATPEVKLYAQVMLAIGECGGLNYQQQYKDHAKYYEGNIIRAFFWDGFNGNLVDNPGTLRSETLNQASHLIDIAYQNIRDQLSNYRAELEKPLDKVKNIHSTNSQEELYRIFYDENVKDDLVFKNPFTDDKLDDSQRELLKKVLLDINKRRDPSIHTMEDLETKILTDSTVLLVPLIKKSGKSVGKSVSNFFSNLRETLTNFNPKNWKDSIKESVAQMTADPEERPEVVDNIWEMQNSIDASKNPNNREEIITMGGGIENFEINLEMLALKHEYAYIQKNEINKVLPFIKALSIHLANQGIILNDNFENDINYIQNFIKAKVQNKSLQNLEALGKAQELTQNLMKATSILALAFNPKQLYQIIDGLWKDIRIVYQNSHADGDKAFSFQNFKDSFFWILHDVANFGGELSVGEGLNQLYGINDMDINSLPSRYAKDTYGTDRLQKAMFRFASRPDYYNRLTIFGAQMRGDGCFDAHSIKDGKLVYDWTKDKRFDVFAAANGDINKATDKEKFNQQKALYYAMAQDFVREGAVNPDGTLFELDINHPKALPKAYTVKQSEAMKALGDRTYGYYASEKKSLIQSFTLGALFFQMNTFWSSKKNQYFSGRGYSQEGEYVQYEETDPNDPTKTIKWFQKWNEETQEMDFTTEDTGLPLMVWKGRPQEGIIMTLNHLIAHMLLGKEGNVISRYTEFMEVDDPYLRRLYRNNLRQLMADLFGILFIGLLVAPSLTNAANSYAKERGVKTFPNAAMGWAATLGASMFAQSADDFVFYKSVFGRGVQWTPFSIQSGWRALTGIAKCATGDTDLYDTIAKNFAATRNSKPIFNYIKLNTLGREIGDNGKEE